MAEATEEQVIEYSPEEQEEIGRIVSFISQDFLSIDGVEPEIEESASESSIEEEPSFDEFTAAPEGEGALPVSEPEMELPEIEPDITGLETAEAIDEIPDIEPELPEISEELVDVADEMASEELPDIMETPEDLPGILEEDLELPQEELAIEDIESASEEEIEDITDIVHEVEEETPADEIIEEPLALDEEIPDFGDMEEVQAGSTLDQLDALTDEEPESLDIQDIAEDSFVETPLEESTFEEEPMVSEDLGADIPELDLGDLDSEELPLESLDESIEEPAFTPEEESIPDLSEIGGEEDVAIPEAGAGDIPELDFDDLGGDDLPSIAGPIEEDAIESDTGMSEYNVQELDEIDISADDSFDQDLIVEPLEEAEDEVPVSTDSSKDSMELGDKELRKLKKAILLFNPSLISAIKDTVIHERLPGNDIRRLIDMILSGKPEDNIHRFLEKKLGTPIALAPETGRGGRRVLTARPEYSRTGIERQKHLLKFTKIVGAAAIVAMVAGFFGYTYVYIPFMAKHKIEQGVELILDSGDYRKKTEDYSKAEKIFDDVLNNYIDDYIYGYNAYGRAYFVKKEYQRSLSKINSAYKNNPADADILNSLGHFYSRVPSSFYKSIEPRTPEWYFRKDRRKAYGKSQLDLSIHFFRQALILEKDNVDSLVGIGDAYFQQGQYFKAKKYYKDILKVDDTSVGGYSGLVNLYIERDAFAELVGTHVEIREKDILTDMPSGLLAKLAGYYLDKRKTAKQNVRIDYGVQSKKLLDKDDNTYPAVREVLQALNSRDAEYPPLQVQYARLARAQNNLPVMKRYLEKAIDISPNYFAAQHLLGAYYMEARQPVEAYDHLNKAIKASNTPPEFTQDIFYRETEEIGNTYALLGNIFYYFFDRVQFRFGDLDDELIESDMEKRANYTLAREKYERALQNNYATSEVYYNLGRIYYLNRMYKKSLEQWLNLYEDFVENPELMLSLGNAFYHMGNYEAARGEYLKLISTYENKVERTRAVDINNSDHIQLFETLAITYNNLGSIYQIRQDESRSGISYWKSIDFAKRINTENEYARVNLARSMNRKVVSEPVLDERIPYSIEAYRENMRKLPTP